MTVAERYDHSCCNTQNAMRSRGSFRSSCTRFWLLSCRRRYRRGCAPTGAPPLLLLAGVP